MEIMLTIDCDKCNDSHVITIEGESAIKTLKNGMNPRKIMEELRSEGWHVMRSCLCPVCRDEVGEDNCMNCRNQKIQNGCNLCYRKISENAGLVMVCGDAVSEYDTCEHFER